METAGARCHDTADDTTELEVHETEIRAAVVGLNADKCPVPELEPTARSRPRRLATPSRETICRYVAACEFVSKEFHLTTKMRGPSPYGIKPVRRHSSRLARTARMKTVRLCIALYIQQAADVHRHLGRARRLFILRSWAITPQLLRLLAANMPIHA